MVGYIFRNYSASADEGVTADGMAADDGAVGAKRCALFDEGGAHLVHFADFSPRVVYVGEYHRRAAENAVFKCNTFINADVVLDFAFIADDGVGADNDVLANVAVFAYFGTGKDVGEMPDFRFFANGDVVVHNCCWMGEKSIILFNVQSSMFNVRSTVFYVGKTAFF